MIKLVLASRSVARVDLLKKAGLTITAIGAEIDERAAEAPLAQSGAPAEDIAQLLAEVKAQDVSHRFPEHLVIGADQTLSVGDQRLNKPQSDEEARRQLLTLSGKEHQLHSALACVLNGQTIWRHLSTARLTMRSLSPEQIGHYMAHIDEDVRSSVGCYHLEGLGIQLFEAIEGDYFTILGLPLLPLLAYLRQQHGLDFEH